MNKSNNQVKERPIVLSTDEVRAVLEGCKSQHRVLIAKEGDASVLYNPKVYQHDKDHGYRYDGMEFTDDACVENPRGDHYVEGLDEKGEGNENYISIGKCPFGSVGDRFWVKEDWKVGAWNEKNGNLAIDYKASPETTNTPWVQIDDDPTGEKFTNLWIELSDELNSKGVEVGDDGNYHWEAGKSPLDWRKADDMPHWASRLTLEITDVRIERIKDITHNNVLMSQCFYFDCENPPISMFVKYWMEKHGDDAWRDNPWVWVIDFKVAGGA